MWANVLNLAAIAAGVTLALLGVRLLARRVRAQIDAAEMACGHCGNPASTLTDFTCPACKRDVRDGGLLPRGPGRGAAGQRVGRPLVAWTALVLILACVVTIGVGERMSGYLMERETDRAWVGKSPIRNLRCVALARGAKSSSLPTVTAAAAELQFADGRLATLEFEGQGGARMTARDTSGLQIFTGRTFELAAVREWLAASTARDALDDLDAWAMVVYWEIADLVLPSGRSTPGSALFPGGRVGATSVFSTSKFGSSGSGSASTRQEPWPAGLLRCAVVLWPATWLAGLAAALPPARRRPPAEREPDA